MANPSEDKDLQARYHRATRLCQLLQAQKRIGKLVLQRRNRKALLQEACQTLVTEGGFLLAWGALWDGQSKTPTYVATSRTDQDFLVKVQAGRFPQCVRTCMQQGGVTRVSQPDQCPDCVCGCSRAEGAVLCLRLEYGKQLIGFLSVWLDPGLLAAEVEALLQETVDDLSLALHELDPQPGEGGLHLRYARMRLALIEFAAEHNLQDLLTRVLDEVGASVRSPLGFFHFVAEDQNSLTMQQWSTSTREGLCHADAEAKHYPIDEAGLWADCVRTGRTMVYNDYDALPHRKGLPEGHAELTRLLLAPVLRGNLVVAILGFGNKPEEYTERDVELVSFFADVTWEIVRQKRTHLEQERLLRAVEQVDEMVVITDDQGIIEYVNPAFERVTGYSRAEAIGQNPRLLQSGEHDPAFYQELWSTITAGRTFCSRMINRKKDGTRFTEEATISPVRDRAGKITNYVAVKRDISARLALEDQLRQSLKMESVGRLAGGVAHDFNNGLNVILGHAELALASLSPEDPLYAELSEIRKAAIRSAGLTRQLLAFARRQSVAPEVLDLNHALEDLLNMLRRLMGENIELLWRAGPDLWHVHLDPAQLYQVLVNLCVNSRDAIAEHGRVTIETGNVVLDEAYCSTHRGARPGEFVCLTVSDDGCGMDEQTRAKVFEPFFTTKPLGSGTGLGLATVYGIVKQNEGFVFVDSEPGHGTTFRLYFPRHLGEGPIQRTDASALEFPTGNGQTILVVEDDAAILKLARRMLGHLGYKVLTASGPLQALELAEQEPGPIDLLLTDVILPEMNGRQLAERLGSLMPGLRLLYMSGYTADIITSHGIVEEGLQLLGKPFSVAELAAAVGKALG
ncbi:MAG: GAF domain-containing protein [Vulcanimicrobiota bacterium]